uniref:Uncharacterized protein n=1 Tax=Nelumbo nucifera TaxID=4432 RepID=A0A822Z1P0_NELNU|nr:TPA_asm: hypothetical protein HUJ06_008040 [Nelumbo nucifera]
MTCCQGKKTDRKSEKASVRNDHSESPIQRTSPMLEEVVYGLGRLRGEGYIIEHAQDKKPSVYEHEKILLYMKSYRDDVSEKVEKLMKRSILI